MKYEYRLVENLSRDRRWWVLEERVIDSFLFWTIRGKWEFIDVFHNKDEALKELENARNPQPVETRVIG